MLAHAYAPSQASAPRLYVHYTWVRELGLHWGDLGGISSDDVGRLAEMVNIQREADELKQRVAQGGKRK